MNRTELIKRIIERLYDKSDHADLTKILEEELPDFNPMRIDEERFKEIGKRYTTTGLFPYWAECTIQEYNSTLPSPLVPLPKEMPEGFMRGYDNIEQTSWWYWVRSTYGTPSPKPSLPSVEELTGEVVAIYGATHTNSIHDTLVRIAQNIHSKYSLHPKQPLPSYHDLFKELYQISVKSQSTILISTLTKHLISKYSLHPKQEWWMKLKEGDKFKWEKEVQKFKKFRIYLVDEDGITYLATTCTPYTTPSAQDIISKHNLTDEEVRVIREGNV